MSALHLHLACFVNVSPPCLMSSALFAAGHQPAADHILDPFEIFGSMVPSVTAALCSQQFA